MRTEDYVLKFQLNEIKMASALEKLQGFGRKVQKKEQSACRILKVNLPQPTSADIEFRNITLTVSEGLASKSKCIFCCFVDLACKLRYCQKLEEISFEVYNIEGTAKSRSTANDVNLVEH